MLSFISGFLNRNRTKLIIATVALTTIGTLYYIYNTSSSSEIDDDMNQDDDEKYKHNKHSIHLLSPSHQSKLCNRSRIIWKIRKQYDHAINKLLITFKFKIIELIDIQNTVHSIKELRGIYKMANNNSKDNTSDTTISLKKYEELEEQLWDEIKISTFVFLIVLTYITPAICVLLKIQLHILARSLLMQLNDVNDLANVSLLDSDMFRSLIEGTFKHIYGHGLESFITNVREAVTKHFSSWIVKQKIQVEAYELNEALQLVREEIELKREQHIIQVIFTSLDNQPQNLNSSVQTLLNQTWDLLESPEFCDVYKESVDTTYRIINADIQHHIFSVPPVDYYSHIMSGSTTTTAAAGTTECNPETPLHQNYSSCSSTYRPTLNSPYTSSNVKAIDSNDAIDRSEHVIVDNQYPITTPPATPIVATKQSNLSSAFKVKAPPLASLLPQIKAIALKLLPSTNTTAVASNTTGDKNNISTPTSSSSDDSNPFISKSMFSPNSYSSNSSIVTPTVDPLIIDNNDVAVTITLVSKEIKEISSGAYLESFCIAILDTANM